MNLFKTFRLCVIFIIMFSCGLYSDENFENSSHFGTHTTYHENGDTAVTYEHSGSTDNWDYQYSATFEHVTYDTTEFTTMTHAEFSCTSRDDVDDNNCNDHHMDHNHNDQSDISEKSHDNNHEQEDYQTYWLSDDVDYNEHLKDMARNREYNRIEDHNNQSIKDLETSQSRTPSSTTLYDYDAQRSIIYQVFKGIKESLFGKSQRTIERERIQKIAREQEVVRKKAQQEVVAAEKLERQQIFNSELEQAYEQHQQAVKSSHNQEFLKIMHDRDDPFEESLHNQKPKLQKNKLTPSTIGFLQVHNIDYQKFLQLSGVAIQHHLIQELIENINIFTTLADTHFSNQKIFPLIQSGVLVSGMAQDYNQATNICDAMSATNCSHGFLNYVQVMVDSGIKGCAKFATALSFFGCEFAQYTLAATRGVANGIVASEISGIILSGLNMLAPGLTSAVYAGAISIIVPIAVTAGFLCSAALMTELARCGYLCLTNQYDNLEQELEQIKNFAQQFYNFDQAPTQHVENLATLATTLVWPSQRQAVFEYLMDMQKVTCTVWIDAKNFVSQTRVATQNQLHSAFESIKNNELTQFKIIHKKIFDEHIFDLFPARNPGLVPAGMQGLINPSDQNRLVQLLMAQESSTGGNAIKSGLSLALHNLNIQDVIQAEIAQALQYPPAFVDLSSEITVEKAVELATLSLSIRQLQDLAMYTNNFTNLENLIPEDILYLNRIYELQEYRAHIKSFLDTYKPYFMYKDHTYYIKDIASYHIHAGEYFIKKAPSGGHSNFKGNKLDCFKATIVREGPLGTKDLKLYNSRVKEKIKPSSCYPENWSEYLCDLKAIELITSKNIDIFNDTQKFLRFEGQTIEGLDIIIHYDIVNQRITSHYPNVEKF